MSSNARPPPARRGPSSTWGRLRTSPIDPLEAYGLPSKGETRLTDPKAQESYLELIMSRYMKFCAECGTSFNLAHAFTSLNVTPDSGMPFTTSSNASASAPSLTLPSMNNSTRSLPLSLPHTGSVTPTPQPSTPPPDELPKILMAMRKLRESLVSASRTDAFAQRAYIVITRVSILSAHLESYHPSLLYLLQKIHPRTPLSLPETAEFAAYLVLDLACRQQDLGAAYAARARWHLRDRALDDVLVALVRGDWVAFWRAKDGVDGYRRQLMAWAEGRVRSNALKCLGRAYLSADKGFVERSAGKNWEELVREDGVGWELDGERGAVTIRKMKARGG